MLSALAGMSLPLLMAAIASFAFGAVWYGVLGKQWAAARGLSEVAAKAQNGAFSCAVHRLLHRPPDHGPDALRRPCTSGARRLGLVGANRHDLRLSRVARVRHHHHGRQPRLPGRAALAYGDRRRPLAGCIVNSRCHPRMVGTCLIDWRPVSCSSALHAVGRLPRPAGPSSSCIQASRSPGILARRLSGPVRSDRAVDLRRRGRSLQRRVP